MDSHLSIFLLLSVAVVASHAALSPEAYWKSVLPNTPMPKAVTDSLISEWSEDKSTSVAVGKGNVNVNTGKGKSGGTNVNVGGKGVGVHTGKPGKGTSVGVGKGGVTVGTGHKGKPVYVGVKPGYVPFLYKYAATDDQLLDNSNVALFFLEKDLKTGQKMTLHFTKSTNPSTFLPRQVAQSIPFSVQKLPEIMNRFSVKPNSEEAGLMKKTIQECQESGIKGEDKFCATSLESMVDYTKSKLGLKDVKAISTEGKTTVGPQGYSIEGVEEMGAGEGAAVVCHKQEYAYAVFYCHKTQTTKAYMVSLVGADGTKANAVAVCHKDTSAWNPKHLAFRVLKVKPGSVPVCHFLPEDHIVWVAN